jgi:dienelactone hydrolase
VIAFPGRSAQTQKHARMLTRHGYGVLLFDRRGDGQSEGDPYRWDGNKDVKAALAFLQGQPDIDADRIGGLGLSLGGELLLKTAAESQALRAVASEGAGVRTIREHMDTTGAGKWLLAPQMAVTTGATAVFANHAPPPNLKDLIGRIAPRPVFLIYAPTAWARRTSTPRSTRPQANPRRSGSSPRQTTPAASTRAPPSTSGEWWASSTTRCSKPHDSGTRAQRSRSASERASPLGRARRLPGTAMKEDLLGGTLDVSARSELEEARLRVARWVGSESTKGRRLSVVAGRGDSRGVGVAA